MALSHREQPRSSDDIRHIGARSLNSEVMASANLLISCIFNLALLYGLKS